MSERLPVTPPRAPSAWQKVSLTLQTLCNCPGVERRPRSAATSLLPLRFVCFLVFQPPERSCFTKRLVNISVRTRWRQERGGEGGSGKKRQEKTICASVVSASSVWVSKGPLCSTHNEERRLGGRKQPSLPFAFLFLCLGFVLLRIARSGGRGRWEEREAMGRGKKRKTMEERKEQVGRCWESLCLMIDDPKDDDERGWGAKRGKLREVKKYGNKERTFLESKFWKEIFRK